MTSESQTVDTSEAKPMQRATKRRGKGEGSIFQRADGRWCASIVIGRNEDGKRIRRTVYGKVKREVQARLTAMQGQRQAGSLRDTRRQTVAECLNHWLACIEIKARPNTHAGYADAVKRHISPSIGGLQLAALSAEHVENVLVRLKSSGVSTRSIRRAFETLRTALNHAVKIGAAARNPCDNVECAKPVRKDVEPYTLDQARQLLKASKATWYHALFVLAIDAGMRQGELFGLKWEDIDLDRGALVVRRALGEVHGKPYWCEPKSKTSRRRLALSPLALDALREHRKQSLAEGRAAVETVFCNADGGLLGKSNFRQRVWLPLLAKAELPVKRFHDLRHTNASLLIELGEHPKTIQARLGHSQIGVTMNTYGHLMEGTDRLAANRLGNLLSAETGASVKTA
jgi:integrase